MKIIDIRLNIIESTGEKEMKYYLTQGKRKIAAMRRSAKTPAEAVFQHKCMLETKKELLDAIGGSRKMNDDFPKGGIGVSCFLTAFLAAIIFTMVNYGIGIWNSLFALLTFAALFQVLIITKRVFETIKFIESGKPQKDLKEFVKTQENMLLAEFKNTRINPYSGELEILDGDENA